MSPAPRRIGLLFGGRSTEHEVSVRSARNIQFALNLAGDTVVPIGVTIGGRWLGPDDSARVLAEGAPVVQESDSAVEILPDPSGRGLWEFRGDARRPLLVDAVFPIIHGAGGEDGRLQSQLELAGLPYAGPGPLASAICMDKGVTKDLLRSLGLPVVPGRVLSGADLEPSGNDWAVRVSAELNFPLFVKPANGGSSVGIRKVTAIPDLESAVRYAATFDDQVLIEQGIDAIEVECAVLGNERIETSILGEIATPDGFYDYDSKYLNDSAELIVPARLPDAASSSIRALAANAYRALRLEGFARVDFLVEKDQSQYYINEINTLPGFTEISMFPKLWEATGLHPAALVTKLVDLGISRFDRRNRLSRELVR